MNQQVLFAMIFLGLGRLILSTIFLGTSLPKLRHFHAFASAVQGYQLLPKAWVRPFALALPRLELALGLMLLVGWQTRIAAVASVALLLIFLTAMGLNLARGRKDLHCGCSSKKHAQKIS